MKAYSIFIVGMYGIPSHIIRFVRNLKQTNPSVSITLFSDRKKDVFQKEIGDYLDKYIQCEKYTGWPKRLWKFRRLFDQIAFERQLRNMTKENTYDIVNIHYPTSRLYNVMKYFRKMSRTVVVSPWGSDVLRVSDKEKKRLRQVFKNSDYITVGSGGIFGKVLCQEMRIGKEKFHPLAWGSETIDYINEHLSEISVEQAKELLGLSGKYVITCGYNAFEEQRHEIIVNAINNKRRQLPDNMILLFPLTYGSSYGNKKQQHVDKVKSLCEELSLPTKFYENYLSVSELFLLRRATDMFIHIQPTDGGNSSLQEYVLCGAKIVHGSWIKYNNLEQYKPLFYYPVNDLDELGDVIVDAYRSESIRIPEQVMEFIRNRGWKAKMMLWDDFFVSCLKS